MITAASSEWVLLSVVYHHVLARSPSPEAAKIAIANAWTNGQLRWRCTLREIKRRYPLSSPFAIKIAFESTPFYDTPSPFPVTAQDCVFTIL
jgi:hypothetical protein